MTSGSNDQCTRQCAQGRTTVFVVVKPEFSHRTMALPEMFGGKEQLTMVELHAAALNTSLRAPEVED